MNLKLPPVMLENQQPMQPTGPRRRFSVMERIEAMELIRYPLLLPPWLDMDFSHSEFGEDIIDEYDVTGVGDQ